MGNIPYILGTVIVFFTITYLVVKSAVEDALRAHDKEAADSEHQSKTNDQNTKG